MRGSTVFIHISSNLQLITRTLDKNDERTTLVTNSKLHFNLNVVVSFKSYVPSILLSIPPVHLWKKKQMKSLKIGFPVREGEENPELLSRRTLSHSL